MKTSQLLRCATLPVVVRASDVVFNYPRYNAGKHLTKSLPEVAEASAILSEPTWEKKDRALEALERGREIFANLGGSAGGAVPPALAKELRFIVASKIRVLQSSGPAPKAAAQPNGNDRLILADAGSVLTMSSEWSADKPPAEEFDAMCVIVSSYIRSFATVHRMKSKEAIASEKATLEAAAQWLRKLQGIAIREKEDRAIVKLTAPLLMLEAILQVALDGNLVKAVETATRSVQLASDLLPKQVGVYHAVKGEIQARLWNWSNGPGFVDEEIVSTFKHSHQAYSALFGHPGMKDRQDPIETIAGHEELRDNFTQSLASTAQFYLQAPHNEAKEDWLPAELFSYSPIVNMPLGGDKFYVGSVKLELSHENATKQALHLAERALKVNRNMMPDDRDNLKAAELIRTMGLAYADLKDYLYATGMWNVAKRIYDTHYGPHSKESMDTMMLLEVFQRKVKSVKEADATQHHINAILAQHGIAPK